MEICSIVNKGVTPNNQLWSNSSISDNVTDYNYKAESSHVLNSIIDHITKLTGFFIYSIYYLHHNCMVHSELFSSWILKILQKYILLKILQLLKCDFWNLRSLFIWIKAKESKKRNDSKSLWRTRGEKKTRSTQTNEMGTLGFLVFREVITRKARERERERGRRRRRRKGQ